MVISLQGDSLKLLEQVGFTETQAKIYITLCQMGQTDAKSLAKQADTPRQAAYRTLGELQQKGMVEKIIAIPQQYRAIPIHEGLSIMIGAKAKEYASLAERAKEFIQRYEVQTRLEKTQEEYNISIVEGKETILKKICTLTDACSKEIWLCQPTQRWIQVNLSISKTVKEALRRGVKYHAILEQNQSELAFPKDLKSILKHPNYEVRIARKLKINAALYDDKNGCFSVYPSKAVGETPIIVTNHPSLLIGFRDYFSNQWRDSKKLDN
jgi:HTH-type transcriptional regulator, sugar sensing transcriptional regulator